MKRFYCTICKKIKRVRNLPPTIKTPNADNPTDRIGQCSYHPTSKTYINNERKLAGVR